jgi:acyl dehydratase
VALNRDFLGRTFPPGAPYEVSRVKIAEFADAIGEPSPLCRDRDAAIAAGYPDVIAPPTFAIVVSMGSTGRLLADADLGLDYAMVVHGEQRFEHARPLHAGDVVVAQSTISGIKNIGRHAMLTTQTDIRTVDGEHVCTAHSSIVERGA